MNGKASKKIRQQFSREFRKEVETEAKKLVKEKSAEMEGAVERMRESLFKKRPKFIPRWIWRLGIARFCNITELEVNGLGSTL